MQSQAQRGLMYGIASGSIPAGRGGPSKAVAREFVASDHPGKLPERVGEKRRSLSGAYGKKGVRRG